MTAQLLFPVEIFLPALFGNTGLDGSERFFLAQQGSEFIAFTIGFPEPYFFFFSSSFGGFSDHCILNRNILFLCFNIVCSELNVCHIQTILRG